MTCQATSAAPPTAPAVSVQKAQDEIWSGMSRPVPAKANPARNHGPSGPNRYPLLPAEISHTPITAVPTARTVSVAEGLCSSRAGENMKRNGTM